MAEQFFDLARNEGEKLPRMFAGIPWSRAFLIRAYPRPREDAIRIGAPPRRTTGSGPLEAAGGNTIPPSAHITRSCGLPDAKLRTNSGWFPAGRGRLPDDRVQISKERGEASASPQKVRLRFRVARLAIRCQFICRMGRRYCSERLSSGRAEYHRALCLIDGCERASRGLADVRLDRDGRPPPDRPFYERYAQTCQDCAEECDRLGDPQLHELLKVCHETGLAWWQLDKVEREEAAPVC